MSQLDEVVVEGRSSLNERSGNEGRLDIGNPSTNAQQSHERSQKITEFIEELQAALRKPFPALDEFMAFNSHPRFVWRDILGSFPTDYRRANTDKGRQARQKLSNLIKSFPDVLQRELYLDDRELDPKSDSKERQGKDERSGVLHGAVRCGRTEILGLVLGDQRGDDKELVQNALCSPVNHEEDHKGWDRFDRVQRALLWRNMLNDKRYLEVAAFLKEFEIVRNSSDIKRLKNLIEKSAAKSDVSEKSAAKLDVIEQSAAKSDVSEKSDAKSDASEKSAAKLDVIDLKDVFDPWIVVLVWASVAGRCHIVRDFKNIRQILFEDILKTLENDAKLLKMAPLLLKNASELSGTTKGKADSKRVLELVPRLILWMNRGPRAPISFKTIDKICARNSTGRRTALHLAAALGDHTMVDALIKYYDNIVIFAGKKGALDDEEKRLRESFHDAFWMTPLHCAVLANHKEVVEKLMGWKFFDRHVNDFDIFMRTAFQVACSRKERAAIVKLMLENPKLEPNTKDCCGFTPLHWAVYTGVSEAVSILVSEAEKGKGRIRVTEINTEGVTPYKLAEYELEPATKKDVQGLLLRLPEVKEGVERSYRDRQIYVDSNNAILVVAALIASVTFGGWLQPPFGNQQSSTLDEVRLFWAFNSLAFYFSVATVMAGAGAILPFDGFYIEDAVGEIRDWLVITSFLLLFSVAFVLGAFASSGFASLSSVPHLRNNMTITTSIGSVVCGLTGLQFCYRFFRIRPNWLNYHSKWFLPNLLKITFRKILKVLRTQDTPEERDTLNTTLKPEIYPLLVNTTLQLSKICLLVVKSVPSYSVVRDIVRDENNLREYWHLKRLGIHNSSKICGIRCSCEDLGSFLLSLEDDRPVAFEEYKKVWEDIIESDVNLSSEEKLVDETDGD